MSIQIGPIKQKKTLGYGNNLFTKIIHTPSINHFVRKLARGVFFYDARNRWQDKRSYKENNHLSKYKIKELINKDNPVIVEIGASTGDDSVRFLQVFRDNIQLHCIEPSPLAIKKFEERLNQYKKRHKFNLKLYNLAISNKNGYAKLQLLDDDPNCVMSTLKDFTEETKKCKTYTGRVRNLGKKVEIKTMTLDNWAKENRINLIDFLWSDTEGSERELIEGGLKTLNEKTRYFYFEMFPENESIWKGQLKLRDVLKLLPNFEIFGIFSDGGYMVADVLLKNNRFK